MILFVCFYLSSLADAWEDDVGVHSLKFPSETCLELLLVLALSTASLPPSLRGMNSFQVRNCLLFPYQSVISRGKKKRAIPGAINPPTVKVYLLQLCGSVTVNTATVSCSSCSVSLGSVKCVDQSRRWQRVYKE